MGADVADRRIARVERGADVAALALGVLLLLAAPASRVTAHAPTLLIAAGVVLLGSGLMRDLAWLALAGRPAAAAPAGASEVRTCLESALGVLAVGAGLTWRLVAPGPPRSLSAGALVLALALVATFGQATRNVIVTFRVEPGHRNMPFWP